MSLTVNKEACITVNSDKEACISLLRHVLHIRRPVCVNSDKDLLYNLTVIRTSCMC